MQDLLQQFQGFNSNTKTEVLNAWAKKFEKHIGRLSEDEKGYYYLLLSELHAIYLRNIQQAKSILKTIRNPKYPLSEQIKVRRCFYKYLEGDYENATQTLQEIASNTSNSSHRIAKDFFSRIYFKDNYSSFGKNQIKINRKQSYQIDFLKAVREERKGMLKFAREIHKQIIANYGDLDQAIEYQSAQHILLLVSKEGVKPNRQQMQKYMDIVSNYQAKLENKKYYQEKIEFIMKIMDLIETQSDQQQEKRMRQLTKQFVVEKLKKAIAEEQDEETLQKFKTVLNALKESKTSGEEVCFKFMGDKQISQLSKLRENETQSKVKIKQSKMPKALDESEQQQQKNKSKMSKTPMRSKVNHVNADSQSQQDGQESKLKKTPLRSKASKDPEEQEEYQKLKSKIGTESNKSKMKRNQEQPQDFYGGKSKMKSQNQQKYSKILRLPDQNQSRLRKNSKYVREQERQIEQSQLYNLKSKSRIRDEGVKQTNTKRTDSKLVQKLQIDPDFQGSNMTKVNYNSGGHEQRYFYIKQDFEQTMKLYFCSKKQKKSSSDQFYRLKGLKKVTLGKKSDALKRSQCQDFPSELCFTLYISTADEEYERNFYVKEKEDYEEWVKIFKYLLSRKDIDNMRTKTRVLMK